MLILGIVGSPRKNGRTHTLVDAALGGAAQGGAETEKLYLIDYAIKPFTGSGGSEEGVRFCPSELSERCEAADAIVLGAPVYYGDINGLTKDFMDSVRIGNSNGKPALGFAIAGGSGKGLISGVQSIYHWFYHRQVRAIDPTPVSRFNMAEALEGSQAVMFDAEEEQGEAEEDGGEHHAERIGVADGPERLGELHHHLERQRVAQAGIHSLGFPVGAGEMQGPGHANLVGSGEQALFEAGDPGIERPRDQDAARALSRRSGFSRVRGRRPARVRAEAPPRRRKTTRMRSSRTLFGCPTARAPARSPSTGRGLPRASSPSPASARWAIWAFSASP